MWSLLFYTFQRFIYSRTSMHWKYIITTVSKNPPNKFNCPLLANLHHIKAYLIKLSLHQNSKQSELFPQEVAIGKDAIPLHTHRLQGTNQKWKRSIWDAIYNLESTCQEHTDPMKTAQGAHHLKPQCRLFYQIARSELKSASDISHFKTFRIRVEASHLLILTVFCWSFFTPKFIWKSTATCTLPKWTFLL